MTKVYTPANTLMRHRIKADPINGMLGKTGYIGWIAKINAENSDRCGAIRLQIRGELVSDD